MGQSGIVHELLETDGVIQTLIHGRDIAIGRKGHVVEGTGDDIVEHGTEHHHISQLHDVGLVGMLGDHLAVYGGLEGGDVDRLTIDGFRRIFTQLAVEQRQRECTQPAKATLRHTHVGEREGHLSVGGHLARIVEGGRHVGSRTRTAESVPAVTSHERHSADRRTGVAGQNALETERRYSVLRRETHFLADKRVALVSKFQIGGRPGRKFVGECPCQQVVAGGGVILVTA